MIKTTGIYAASAIGILAVGGALALVGPRTPSGAAARSPGARSAQADHREITIPTGTTLSLTLDSAVGSATSEVDDPVRAHLAEPVVLDGLIALPKDSQVQGAVTAAERSARVKGRGHIAMRFDTITLAGDADRHEIRTASVSRTAPGTVKKDAFKIGLPAAGGAAVGGLIGGKKGALIGGAAGGGAGTAVVLSTRGPDVHLTPGTRLTVRLVDPLTVQVRVPRNDSRNAPTGFASGGVDDRL